MKRQESLLSLTLALLVSFCLFTTAFACTIASGTDRHGEVWNANNEDGPFGVANFINVFPKEASTKFGYYTLSYISPIFGEGGQIQGGMNEAGLTFDFAAIEPINQSNLQGKQPFPAGNDAILPHILANLSSTAEVVEFFETYWFEGGFNTAQMHVADKNGVFATISPSGIKVVENGKPLVTTNFDICGKADSSSCWRYPIANTLLSEGASLSTMMDLCKQTAQKKGYTMYSNVQNLSTGDIWFFSNHDSTTTVDTNIKDLVARGKRSYTFSDLKSITEEINSTAWSEPQPVRLEEAVVDQYVGTYKNWYVGEITVTSHEDELHIKFPFEPEEVVLMAQSDHSFYIPETKFSVEFTVDEENNKKEMRFLEEEFWSFTAWQGK